MQSSCVVLQTAGMIGVHHHTQLLSYALTARQQQGKRLAERALPPGVAAPSASMKESKKPRKRRDRACLSFPFPGCPWSPSARRRQHRKPHLTSNTGTQGSQTVRLSPAGRLPGWRPRGSGGHSVSPSRVLRAPRLRRAGCPGLGPQDAAARQVLPWTGSNERAGEPGRCLAWPRGCRAADHYLASVCILGTGLESPTRCARLARSGSYTRAPDLRDS